MKINLENKQDLGASIQISQENCREYNIPLCVVFVDYEKSFDSVQTQAILTSLQEQGIEDVYIEILKDMCALWVNYRKTTFHQFTVAYNNSYRILNRLPMRCSASGMFASDNVTSCTCVIRKSIYSLTTKIFKSTNPIVKSIVWGDVYCTSALRNRWMSQLYSV